MKQTFAATLIALGLIGLGLTLGLFLHKGLTTMSSSRCTVAVRGLSEREVEANKVTWPLVFNVIGNDLQDLNTQIEAGQRSITRFLKDHGLSESDYTPIAPQVVDKQASRWSNEEVRTRYMATSGILVITDKIGVVRDMIQQQGELMKKGVALVVDDYAYQTIYEYTQLNDIKPEMIAEATRKAHEAAEKFAEDSGSKVGKILSATQGQFSIEDRDPYTPHIKKVRVVTTMTYKLEE